MKLSRMALSAALACVGFAGSALAQQNYNGVAGQRVAYNYGYGDEASPSDIAPMAASLSGCSDCASAPMVNCDSACDSACDSMSGCGSCNLGDPWTLFGDNCMGFTLGGWTNIGYHTSNNTGTGFSGNGAPANFNNYADHVQLQQQWLYAEKVADGSEGLGFGGRIDYLYGTDAPDTQSFGIPNNHWDNSWDNGGAYGHSIPQLYGEVAYGNTSVKIGHFFTIVGNEVVAATGNFFYSRQFTFYNSEPFTHTGVLATTAIDDDTTLWNGYVMGWDSGFEHNGDAYMGGFSRKLTDYTSLIYTNTLGRLNKNYGGAGLSERGQVHSAIFNTQLTDKLTHILQTDYLYTNDATGLGVRNTFGAINYFIYSINDCWSVGSRTEWYNYSSEAFGIHNNDLYNQTFGINYRPHANLVLRPEVRTIWDQNRSGVNENNAASMTVFGMDAVFTF